MATGNEGKFTNPRAEDRGSLDPKAGEVCFSYSVDVDSRGYRNFSCHAYKWDKRAKEVKYEINDGEVTVSQRFSPTGEWKKIEREPGKLIFCTLLPQLNETWVAVLEFF